MPDCASSCSWVSPRRRRASRSVICFTREIYVLRHRLSTIFLHVARISCMPHAINALQHVSSAYSRRVEIKTVRLALGKYMDDRGLTQKRVALAAGIDQGHLSKILSVGDDPDELKDLAARVLFQIIEKGFGLRLMSFFQHIEEPSKGTQPAETPTPPGEQVTHAALATPAELAPFEAFGNALGRSIVEQFERRDRQREDPPRPPKKPRRRKNPRSHARRRV